jgi:hypothetical protein
MRFLGLFMACTDASRPEYEPLLAFKFEEAPLILDNYFKS